MGREEVGMDAREFFGAVRAAAIDAERTRRMLFAMESREGVKAQSYAPRITGGKSDPLAVTDARIDREAEWHGRIERAYALIDEACAVIYGTDGRGGVASLMGTTTADAMWWRYCDAASWEKVARVTCYSKPHVQRLVYAALDMVDALGFEAVKAGEGGAT